MNKTSVLELTFYAVLQRSEKQLMIRKFATQTLEVNTSTLFQEKCLSILLRKSLSQLIFAFYHDIRTYIVPSKKTFILKQKNR